MLYIWMGTDISNQAGQYVIEDFTADMESIIESGKTYIEIEYAQPQTFRFYNNQSWSMPDTVSLIFCVDDGTLWYGTQSGSIEKCARYREIANPAGAVIDSSGWVCSAVIKAGKHKMLCRRLLAKRSFRQPQPMPAPANWYGLFFWGASIRRFIYQNASQRAQDYQQYFVK